MLFFLIVYLLMSFCALFLGILLIRRQLEQEEEFKRLTRQPRLSPEEFETTLHTRIRIYLMVSIPFIIVCGFGIFYDTILK